MKSGKHASVGSLLESGKDLNRRKTLALCAHKKTQVYSRINKKTQSKQK